MKLNLHKKFPISKPIGNTRSPFSWQSYWKQQPKTKFGSHLIGYWQLGDLTGLITADSSQYGNNAAYSATGVTLNQSGIYDKPSVKLINASINVNNVDGFTSKFNPDEGFVSMDVASLDSAYWAVNNASLFYFYVDNSNRIFLRGSSGQWTFYHIAGGTSRSMNISMLSGIRFLTIGCRWSKSEGKLSVYINGVEHKSVSVALGDWSGTINSTIYKTFPSTDGLNRYACHHYVLDYAPSSTDIQSCYRSKGVVCFVGDSRTNTKMWHSIAAEDTTAVTKFAYNQYGTIDDGVSGNTVAQIAARAAATNAKQLSGKNNIMVVWCGVNSNALTPQQIYDAITSYCTAARSSGWNKIILCTEIDAVTGTWHDNYTDLNDLIQADHSFVDDIADLGARAELQDATNTTYYNADKLHLIDAGNLIVGAVVNPVLTKYMI